MYGLLSGLKLGLEDLQLVVLGAHAELFCVVDLDVAVGMWPAGCEEVAALQIHIGEQGLLLNEIKAGLIQGDRVEGSQNAHIGESWACRTSLRNRSPGSRS